MPASAYKDYMRLPESFRKRIERDLLNYDRLIKNVRKDHAFIQGQCRPGAAPADLGPDSHAADTARPDS